MRDENEGRLHIVGRRLLYEKEYVSILEGALLVFLPPFLFYINTHWPQESKVLNSSYSISPDLCVG